MSNRNPLVSVIVPAYNAATTIESVLNGLLAQTYSNIEIIVVNDGSSDDTAVIIENAAKQDKRVKLVNQSNAGPGAARNAGLQRAQGQFVMFFDADDDFDPKIIQTMVKNRQKNMTDLVVCGMIINNQGVVAKNTSIRNSRSVVRYALKSLLKQNLLYGPCCKLYRKDIIKQSKIKFNTSMKYGEDTVFVMEYLTKINSLSMVGVPLYRYNYSTNGIAFKNRKNHHDRMLRQRGLLQLLSKQFNLVNIVLGGAILLRWCLSSLKARVSYE